MTGRWGSLMFTRGESDQSLSLSLCPSAAASVPPWDCCLPSGDVPGTAGGRSGGPRGTWHRARITVYVASTTPCLSYRQCPDLSPVHTKPAQVQRPSHADRIAGQMPGLLLVTKCRSGTRVCTDKPWPAPAGSELEQPKGSQPQYQPPCRGHSGLRAHTSMWEVTAAH